MRSRLLSLVALTGIAAAAPSASAETSKGALRVSATVVRSCRVAADAPSVRVDCGTTPQPVRVVRAPATTQPSSPTTQQPPRSITIEF
jgi:hypothetical protein